MHLHAWHILVIAMAGWVNREQSEVIEYVKEKNRVLRELLGDKRPRLNDDQRRRLATKGKALGCKLLSTCCRILTDWYHSWGKVKFDVHYLTSRVPGGVGRVLELRAGVVKRPGLRGPADPKLRLLASS